MNELEKAVFVRTKIQENSSYSGQKVLWSSHAAMRLMQTPWSRTDVESALSSYVLIEDYPVGHRIFPDCLVLGFVNGREPIHAVVALDVEKDRALIVTVYRPNEVRWTNGWRTRK